MNAPLPLSRFKVLDLTHARAGPAAVRQFADWGADVLRVEAGAGIELTGHRDGSDFQNLHRGKRSLSLDLKLEEGLAIFYRLVADVDVLFGSGVFLPLVDQGHYTVSLMRTGALVARPDEATERRIAQPF